MEVVKERKRVPRFFLFIISIMFLFIGVLSISIFVGWNLTRPDREEIKESPKDYQLIYEDISFKSSDDILLKGWWIPAQSDSKMISSNKTIIFSHGYGNNRIMEKISVLKLTNRLTAEGHNVLMFDFRGSGESAGSVVSIGQFEQLDILSAVKFAKEEKESTSIALLGWSMGAVASILAGIQTEDVNAIIADSPFSDLEAYLKSNLPHWSKLPSFPFTTIILGTVPMLSGIDVEQVSPLQAVKELNEKKLLLIHSQKDEAIPYENSEQIYKAALNTENVQLWLTQQGDHIESYLTNQKEYEDKVLSFLNGNK